jgi:hypothetical protein
MVVWVLRRIYCCILLNAIMTNGCTSIMKDLLLYFIECNYDERFVMNIKLTMRCWLGYYEFGLLKNGCMSITKDILLYFIECNYDEWLYEYYEGSTVVFYWMQLWQMVVRVLRRIYYCILLNVIMTNGCMSITKDLPLYYTEC